MSAVAVWNEFAIKADRLDHHSNTPIEALKHLQIALKCIEGHDNDAITYIRNAMMLIEVPSQPSTCTKAPNRAGKFLTGGLAPWQVKRITAYVQDHISGSISLGDLARLVNLSASYFPVAFKTVFGVSPHNYILQQRIEHAKKQMMMSDAPLSEIALACGLSDQAHLSRTFRRITGTTPSAWRRFILRERDGDDQSDAISKRDHLIESGLLANRLSSSSTGLI